MTDKDYSFIEESIRPGRQRNIKRIMKKIGIAALAGMVFGAAAAGGYYIINKVLPEDAGNNSKPDISLVVATEEPEEDIKPTETPASDKEKESESTPDINLGIDDYSKIYGDIYDYCNSYKSTIVTIAKISKETDYFENQIDLTSSFYGLILQIEGNSLYILTDYDNIDGKSIYSILLGAGINVDASLIGLDEVSGIAVLTADVTGVDKDIIDGLSIAELGSSYGINIGDMIVAIGNPMGSMGSIGYGFVCSEPKIEYLTDRSVHIFSCGMQNVENGRGIVMNTHGNVIGIITHRFSSDLSLCNFMGISDLKIIIEQLMNNHSRMGMGIIPRDVGPEYFKDKSIESGIYVSEMAAGSAAMEAGIMVGDIISTIDGKAVKNVGEYMEILSEYKSGDKAHVGIYREYAGNSEIREVDVKLDEIY